MFYQKKPSSASKRNEGILGLYMNLTMTSRRPSDILEEVDDVRSCLKNRKPTGLHDKTKSFSSSRKRIQPHCF